MADLVVPVRLSDHDQPDHLRWSLRTVWHHMEIDRVFIIGHYPSWLDPGQVLHIPSDQTKHLFANRSSLEHRFVNQKANLVALMGNEKVGEEIIWWSDDFYALTDIDMIPYYYRGPLREYVDRMPTPGGLYAEGLRFTLKLLEAWGYPHPDNYATHTPLPLRLSLLREIMDMAWAEGLEGGFMRPLYPVVCGTDRPHVLIRDPKIKSPTVLPPEGAQWASSALSSWNGDLGKMIRDRYWRAAPWEK